MLVGWEEPLNFVCGLLDLGASIRWSASSHTATGVKTCLEAAITLGPSYWVGDDLYVAKWR